MPGRKHLLSNRYRKVSRKQELAVRVRLGRRKYSRVSGRRRVVEETQARSGGSARFRSKEARKEAERHAGERADQQVRRTLREKVMLVLIRR